MQEADLELPAPGDNWIAEHAAEITDLASPRAYVCFSISYAAAAAAAVVVVLTDLPLLLFLMARAYGLWTLRLPQFQRRHQPKQPQTQDALK